MNNACKVVWAGLAQMTQEQQDALAANILTTFGPPFATEQLGHITVEQYDVAMWPLVVVYVNGKRGKRLLGCGHRWPSSEVAEANLLQAESLFAQARVPGRVSVHALYSGPVRVE